MPRAIWSGAISFGLVNVPVRMYSAVAEHKLHFNYVHPDKQPEVENRELEMALDLVDRLRGDFEPERYEDTYRDSLCEIIRRKREGGTISAPEEDEPAEAPDLMAALQASIERSGSRNRNGGGNGEFGKLSKDDLYERAKKEDVPGRSDMSKEELVAALSDSS